MIKRSVKILSSLLFLILIACATNPNQQEDSSNLTIIQKPILYNEQREQLSLEYLKQRYNMIQEKATIIPKMVVVHWTVIPTMQGTYDAFYAPTLPESRAKISSASQLNVSSQYLIDRDGSIYQLLPDTTFARHVIGLNHSAIGIENVGNGTDLPLTDAQLKSNIALIKQLSLKYPIEYVIGHYEYTNFIDHPLWKETNPGYLTDKNDPGEDFVKKVRSGLSELKLKTVPQKKDLNDDKLIRE